MTIWKKIFTVENLNKRFKSLPTMMKHLDMDFVEITSDTLTLRMPVDEKTKQPNGILHGGASAALAETVASMASYLTLEGEAKVCVGIDLNISHLKAVHEGYIRASAKPIRLGSTLQVWEIRTVNDAGDLIALSRLTTMILDKPLEKK